MLEDKQFVALQRGKLAGEAAMLVEEHLADLERSVDNKIYSSIGQSLDPLDAVRWVTEKAAYNKMRKKLKLDQTKGIAASVQLTSTMGAHDG